MQHEDNWGRVSPPTISLSLLGPEIKEIPWLPHLIGDIMVISGVMYILVSFQSTDKTRKP